MRTLATNDADSLMAAAEKAGLAAEKLGTFGGEQIALGASVCALSDISEAYRTGLNRVVA